MAEIRVREVHPHVVARLNEIAKSKSISREELLRRVLERYTMTDTITNREYKIASDVDDLKEMTITVSEKINYLINALEDEEEEEVLE